MRRKAYPKPQTLDDSRRYRLADLFEFTAMPEHEREIMLNCLEREGVPPMDRSSNFKIGNEWFLQFVKFRQWYAGLKKNGVFLKTIDELEADRAARVKQ